jgi:hypothetical protein
MDVSKIEKIAAEIAEGGFGWVEDGQKLLQIIDEINQSFSSIADLKERKAIAYNIIDGLDTKFGWDAPRMTDEVERSFYKQMIDWRITN